MLLDPGMNLTLRPMRYPEFYDRYKAALTNFWTVEKVDLAADVQDVRNKLTPAERHMVNRLIAFFATGDSIVSNNLVLNLYKHVNSPEARMYLSRQLDEEATHVDMYLTLLDTYLDDVAEREAAFSALATIPSLKKKGDFCFKWIDSIEKLDRLETRADRRAFLLNLIAFAACIEGLFFFASFAFVFFLRSKGLLHGLATATNYIFVDETCHMEFAFAVIDTVRREEPDLFDADMGRQVTEMLEDAVECESAFAADTLSGGVSGLPHSDLRKYLEYVADCRLTRLGLPARYGTANPLTFMDFQDVQELTNFFERRPTAYQVGVGGGVAFDEDF